MYISILKMGLGCLGVFLLSRCHLHFLQRSHCSCYFDQFLNGLVLGEMATVLYSRSSLDDQCTVISTHLVDIIVAENEIDAFFPDNQYSLVGDD